MSFLPFTSIYTSFWIVIHKIQLICTGCSGSHYQIQNYLQKSVSTGYVYYQHGTYFSQFWCKQTKTSRNLKYKTQKKKKKGEHSDTVGVWGKERT